MDFLHATSLNVTTFFLKDSLRHHLKILLYRQVNPLKPSPLFILDGKKNDYSKNFLLSKIYILQNHLLFKL